MKNILFILILFIFASCERDITLDLPITAPKIIVDGYVERDLPPYIILSRSQGYFDPINSNSLNNLPERNAIVSISDGINTVVLTELDTIIDGTRIGGIYAAIDPVSFFPTMIGTVGLTYTLDILTNDGKRVTSTTKLQAPVALDSTWFEIQDGKDSLGFTWAFLSDPDTADNCYRWFSKRINKDDQFYAPFGSAFEDKFINGQTFKFGFNRASIQNSTAVDDNNEEAGFFKLGDTIVVKFCTIDKSTFQFWRDAETQLGNNGSPFAVPSNIKSNIVGGIGLFASYSASYDTIIAR
jgi:hypothetical protein